VAICSLLCPVRTSSTTPAVRIGVESVQLQIRLAAYEQAGLQCRKGEGQADAGDEMPTVAPVVLPTMEASN
jgi:hypothetical protein